MNAARILACLTVATAAASPAASQPAPIYEFGEIVVSDQAPRVVEEVTTVDVVTAEEIARSGARTVDEAIALLPGLFVRRGAEGVPLIDIRGLRTRNVLLLLDGVPLNSSFDGLFDLATLSVENVAEIKVTRGAGSMLYGPGGNAGVLNIVTRAAGSRPEASIRLEAADARSIAVAGRASLRLGDAGLVASGSLYEQDYYELSGDFEPTGFEAGGRRTNSDRRDGSAFASLTLDAGERTSLGVNLDYRTVERGKPPVTEDFRQSPFAPRRRFERVDQAALSLHASLEHRFGGGVSLRPAVYYDSTESLTDGYDDDDYSSQRRPGAFREDAETSVWGATLRTAFAQRSRGLTTLAVDARQERWEARGFVVEREGAGAAPAAFADDRSVRVSSVAVEHELTPGNRLAAVLGAGYAVQSRDERDSDGSFNFLLGGTWTLTPSTALRGSVARRIRFPTLRDLYGADRGNPELEAERTLNYEVAIEHAPDSTALRVELALFRVEAEDFIQRTPAEILGNSQRTRFRGLELAGRYRPARWGVDVTSSYTYLEAENRSPEAGVAKIQNAPEHKFTLTIERQTSAGLRVRAELLVVADNFALSRTRPTRALEIGDYAVIGLSFVWPVFAERLRLTGRVDNLLDEDYAESIGFPAPGRRLFVGLELAWSRPVAPSR